MVENTLKNGKKKRKRKRNFVLLCISDAPGDKIKQYQFSRARINFIKSLVAVLFLLVLGFVFFTSYQNIMVMGRANAMAARVQELEFEKLKMADENSYLKEKVLILSDTVNQKVETEKEQQQKNLPTGFPLSGNAEMEVGEETVSVGEDGEETRPLVIFRATDGIFAVAAGAGEVTCVDIDPEYGYQVRIDHGNGYETVYRNGTEPKVKVGDEVARNALLFEMKKDKDNELADVMAYQIIRDGSYIVPTDVLEING